MLIITKNLSFFRSYRRESQTQDLKKKKKMFHILFSQRCTTIFNLLASVFRDLSRQGVI